MATVTPDVHFRTSPDQPFGGVVEDPRNTDSQVPPVETLLQMVGVYNVDLLAEVEGLLRTLTRMQQQVERLRPLVPVPADAAAAIEQREAVRLLAGHVRTLSTKIETLRETLPEVTTAANQLRTAIVGDGDEAEGAR
jgi:hypothetical protein